MLIFLSFIVILGFFILYSAIIYDLFLNKIYPALRVSSYISMGLIDLSVLAANCITPLPFVLFFGLNIWYAVYWWCLSVALAIIFALWGVYVAIHRQYHYRDYGGLCHYNTRLYLHGRYNSSNSIHQRQEA